ncbi:MAG: outer membrane protein transport protein [Bacteroidales bacterium]|nr:outer membrane protein transport protein [Bacteroidales bacterium]
MKRSIIILGFLTLAYALSAQFAEDALRFSELYRQGTARSMAVGGAFGGLGGDFSVLSTNPGGLAIYRSGELSASPEVFNRNTTSTYNNLQQTENRTIFDFANLGWVSAKALGRGGKGWRYYQLGFGMNRLNTFNTNMYMQGPNLLNSKLDVYQEKADGKPFEDIENGRYPDDLTPAWWLYLLDTIPGTTNQYYTPLPYAGTLQTQRINSRGSINEFLFAGAGNFDDVLYLGASVGMPYVRYFRESFYSETDVADTIPYFENWTTTENLETTGFGINFKLGAIVRPVDWVRIGLALHTPTWYWNMRDTWSIGMSSKLDWFTGDTLMPIRTYKYKLTTPMRAIGSLAFVIKKFGFVSFEYEFVNYGQAKLNARDYGFGDENSNIRNYYRSTHNFRAGTEWRISKVSLRAGYAFYGSPYSNKLNDGKRQSFSGGIGYRMDNVALDFAYVYSVKDEDYYFYSTENIQPNPVSNTFTDQNFVLSLRYIF